MTRAEQQQRTREGIVAAAEELFVTQGFHATSVDQIAAAAGYTKGAVYSNFDAKEDVFFAVYERRVDALVSRIGKVLDGGGDVRELILAHASDTVTRRGRDDRWLATFFEFWAHVVRRPSLRARFAEIHARAQAPFDGALERLAAEQGVELPVAARPLAVAMMAMSTGLALEGLVQPEVVDARLGVRVVELVLDDITRGTNDDQAKQATANRRGRAAARSRAGRA
jgi:AcrR family transcriptional regulator